MIQKLNALTKEPATSRIPYFTPTIPSSYNILTKPSDCPLGAPHFSTKFCDYEAAKTILFQFRGTPMDVCDPNRKSFLPSPQITGKNDNDTSMCENQSKNIHGHWKSDYGT